jgi:molybdate transport system ATP-binding protein
MLDRLNVAALRDRKPVALSGGEARRVALARALVLRPRVLLLDEPFAGVDASAAIALRQELARSLDAFDGTTLLVTHDAVDAFMLADRIAVLEAGRCVQIGTANALGAAPASRYVADLVGLNFLRGNVRDGLLTLDDGATLVVAHPVEGPVTATIHPRALSLHRSRPDGSPRNVWPGGRRGRRTVARLRARPRRRPDPARCGSSRPPPSRPSGSHRETRFSSR